MYTCNVFVLWSIMVDAILTWWVFEIPRSSWYLYCHLSCRLFHEFLEPNVVRCISSVHFVAPILHENTGKHIPSSWWELERPFEQDVSWRPATNGQQLDYSIAITIATILGQHNDRIGYQTTIDHQLSVRSTQLIYMPQ